MYSRRDTTHDTQKDFFLLNQAKGNISEYSVIVYKFSKCI